MSLHNWSVLNSVVILVLFGFNNETPTWSIIGLSRFPCSVCVCLFVPLCA